MPTPTAEPLTLQETVLATAMRRRIGNIAVGYEQQGSDRIFDLPLMDLSQEQGLVDQFQRDPKESLAWARNSLVEIAHDPRMEPGRRSRRVDRYLDAYCNLTIKLDRKAFPPTAPGEVRKSVPSYIPHGFNDMGKESGLNPRHRAREIIHVDKAAIFEKYKPVLKELFSMDFSGMSLTQKKHTMLEFLAQKVYFGLPYNFNGDYGRGGKVDLADLSEGVCRHQALVFQTLAQAAGIQSRVLKCTLSYDGSKPTNHAANAVRMDGKWYIVDVTNPDGPSNGKGQRIWGLNAIPVDEPPKEGQNRVYATTLKHSGVRVVYATHDAMNWTID